MFVWPSATSDFDYEFQLASMNRKMSKGLEVMFFLSDIRYTFPDSQYCEGDSGTRRRCIRVCAANCGALFKEAFRVPERTGGRMSMDILMLVDRLEAVINGGWRPPMTDKVMIDEEEAHEVLGSHAHGHTRGDQAI